MLASLLQIVLGLIIVLVAYYLWVTRPIAPFPAKAFIAPKQSIFDYVFGSIFTIIKEEGGAPQLRWMEMARKEGKDVLTYDLWRGIRTVLPLHYEDLQYLLVGDGAKYVIKHSDYARLEPILGTHGLVTIIDEKVHTVQRRLVTPAFSQQSLQGIANNIVTKHGVEMDEEIKKQSNAHPDHIVNFRKIFDSITQRVIVEAAFKTLHISDASAGDIDVENAFETVNENIGLNIVDILPRSISKHISTESRRKISWGTKNVRVAVKVMGDRVRAAMASGNEVQSESGKMALIDYLVREPSLSEEQLSDHALTFAVAGAETSSQCMKWTSYHLAKNPKIQEALLEELKDVIPPHTQPTLDDVKNCEMLNAVIKESLRVSPPVPIVGREVTETVTLPHSGVVVPKGFRVAICIFAIHRNKDVWGEDAEEFKPERWFDPKIKALQESNPAMWMPFLIGKRYCIGQNFAMNEISIALASLVRSYKLEWPEGQEDPQRKWAVTMRPKPDKILLRAIPRDS